MEPAEAPADQLLLVGWDGATWDLLQPWMEAGYLPHLQGLVRDGAWATVPSTPSINSGPAWSTIVTGVNPGRHGIFHLAQLDPLTHEYRPRHGSDRCAPAIWQRMSAAGLPVGVVNVPVSYPADPVDGFMVSGADAPSLDSPGAVHPPGLLAELPGQVRRQLVPNLLITAGDLDLLERRILSSLEGRLEATKHWMQTRPWRFLMVVFTESDWAQHFLWPAEASPSADWSRLRRVFEHLDAALGELRRVAGANTTLMLVSDHGFGPEPAGEAYLLPLLSRLGYFRYRPSRGQGLRYQAYRALAHRTGPAVTERLKRWLPALHRRVRADMRTRPVDWSFTRVFGQRDTGDLYVNLKGRQSQGIVEPDAYEALRDELIQKLLSTTELQTGRPAVRRVWRGEEIYHGPAAPEGPDLVVEFDNDGPNRGLRCGEIEVDQPAPSFFRRTGSHRRDGILVAAGPELRRGSTVEGIALEDIAPTALHLMGRPVPSGLDGRVCAQLLSEQALGARPIRFEAEQGWSGGAASADADPADEAVVLDRLRALGYVEE